MLHWWNNLVYGHTLLIFNVMSPLITAENLHVTRNGHAILNEVSLQVQPHDFVTIIGPNGAGKTMLLKCLMEFYRPDSGRVLHKPDLTVGYVPQRFLPDHTIPINVKRFLTLRKHVQNKELTILAEETGIADFMEKPLHTLSGGELQRVLLARALTDEPELLVLDEPAQNLDISGQLAFYKLLENIYKKRKMAILMVSHDLHLVMASTRQVMCLFHHVCCSGEPQSVAKDPEFIALFGNDMARMMAVYHHEHDHKH